MSIKIFDMSCTHGHRFEAWFSSLEDCDGQLARGLVVCPYCETSDVKRMPRPRTSELTFLLQKTPTEQFLLKRVSYARLPNAFLQASGKPRSLPGRL